MVHRKGLASAAAVVAMACAGIVHAETNSPQSNDGLTLRPAYLDGAVAPAPDRKPLMALMDAVGVGKTLDSMGINMGGYVEGGYNLNLLHGSLNGGNGAQAGRFQDNFSNRAKLDQADFFIEKTVDASKGKFDIGARFEAIYGRDTDFFHSTGLYDNPATFGAASRTYYGGPTQPENQFDINQAYLDVAIPVGTGLRIRAGKFVTPLGYEVINPTQNQFWSHSFLFTYAIPLTQTGIMGEYVVGDWTFDAGTTLGWNQSLRDNNGGPDLLVGVTYAPDGGKKWKFVANLSEGPQSTHDNSDWWTVIDATLTYNAVGDGAAPGSLQLVLNGDYGDAPHGLGAGVGSAQWFGFAGYGKYVCNSMFTFNARLEWYNDANGFTLAGYGFPAFTPPGTTNLYEATLGVSITPLPDHSIGKYLTVRPEVRADYASKAFFPGGNPHFQATFGVDVIFAY